MVSKSYQELVDQYGSARGIFKAMKDGWIPVDFVGNKTKEVIKQELFSLRNSRYPKHWITNKSSVIIARMDKWNVQMVRILGEISALTEAEQNKLYDDVDDMLGVNK